MSLLLMEHTKSVYPLGEVTVFVNWITSQLLSCGKNCDTWYQVLTKEFHTVSMYERICYFLEV